MSGQPVDIEDVWPGCPDDAKGVLSRYSGEAWHLLRRIYQEKVFGEKTISENDLLQGIGRDEKGRYRTAIFELESKGALKKKPKSSGYVYMGNAHNEEFRQDRGPYIAVVEEMRKNKAFAEAMKEGRVCCYSVSETVRVVFSERLDRMIKNKVIASYRFTAKRIGRNEGEGQENAIVHISFICPSQGRPMPEIHFHIDSVTDIDRVKMEVRCQLCGKMHYVAANGRIAS
jgi:hypothetical protein